MTMFWMGENKQDNREGDHALIAEGLKSKNPEDRRQARIAQARINSETPKIKSMREALVKAHRDGNKAEIADIHDFISKRGGYKNEW